MICSVSRASPYSCLSSYQIPTFCGGTFPGQVGAAAPSGGGMSALPLEPPGRQSEPPSGRRSGSAVRPVLATTVARQVVSEKRHWTRPVLYRTTGGRNRGQSAGRPAAARCRHTGVLCRYGPYYCTEHGAGRTAGPDDGLINVDGGRTDWRMGCRTVDGWCD